MNSFYYFFCNRVRGVGTGGPSPPPSFQKTQKVPFSSGALCLREKCCSDCIFDSRMLQSNICESLWLLECGAVKQWEMASLLGAHSLHATRAFQNQKSARQNLHGVRFPFLPPLPRRQHFRE